MEGRGVCANQGIQNIKARGELTDKLAKIADQSIFLFMSTVELYNVCTLDKPIIATF